MSLCDIGLGLELNIKDEHLSDTSEIGSLNLSDEDYSYLTDVSVDSSDECKPVDEFVTEKTCATISRVIGVNLTNQSFPCNFKHPRDRKVKSEELPTSHSRKRKANNRLKCRAKNMRQAKRKLKWVKVYPPESPVTIHDITSNFKVDSPGPRNCPNSHKPLDYFKLFVSDRLIDMMVRETNNFAHLQIKKKYLSGLMKHHSKLKRWYDVTYNEMCTFLAIVLSMRLTGRDINNYWSVKPQDCFPCFREDMLFERFMSIYTMLHITSTYRQPRNDRLIKVRPFLDAVNDAFKRHYIPGQNLSINESLITRINGKCDFIYDMQKTIRAKRVIRKIELIESTSMYTVHMALYSLKDYLEEFKGEQLHYCDQGFFTQKVVYDILQRSRCLDKYYNVFTDLSTNVSLAEELYEHDTFLTGPVKISTKKRNSQYLPKQIVGTRLGELESVFYRKGQTLLLGYGQEHSREPAYLLSTAFNAEVSDMHHPCGLVVQKPHLIDLYKKHMIGADYKNKTINNFSCNTTTGLYWKHFFCMLLDTCLLNAYILYSFHGDSSSNKAKSITEFVEEVVYSLACSVLPSSHQVEHATRHSQRSCVAGTKGSKQCCPGCNFTDHKQCIKVES